MKELAVVAPLLLVATVAKLNVVSLFAQEVGGASVDAGIGNLVGNLGIMGVLVWHLWYHTTKTYPQMQENFRAEANAARQTFLNEQKASRDAFLLEQAQLRENFLREQRESRSHDDKMQTELRQMLTQLASQFRVAVHDVKDTAQVTLNKIQAVQAGSDPRATPRPGG